MGKPILYFDMDNVLVDFKSGLERVSDKVKDEYSDDGTGKPHFDDIPGLFSLMDPVPGAIEAVNALKDDYDVYILSTAPWNNPSAWSDKLLWVKKYFGDVFHKRLILTHNKHLCIQPGAYLIDDRHRHGASLFGDRWIQLGSDRFPDWKSVTDYLLKGKESVMTIEKLQDKCRGSLVGGAVGDALGYEVEFMSLTAIRARFGEKGITRYVLHNGVAEFSDDTQMTLFTLEGLMSGIIDTKAGKTDAILPYIRDAYLNWYKTQTEVPAPQPDSWLSNVRALWARRAPGMTCMGSLQRIADGHEVSNNSKGCGGVMRVAPIGIFNAVHSHIYSYEDTARLAGLAAEMTHKHIASTFASATLAMIVENCIHDEKVDRMVFSWIVDGSVTILRNYFPDNEDAWLEFRNLMHKAMDLAKSEIPDADAIRQLGEGWVGDEALAIAVYSVMRHIENFEDCMVCAVNHDGDSDSTGAIAGNIIGAILGYSSIPQYYIDKLEIEPILVSAADDLCADVKIPEVTQRVGDRYVKHLPVSVAEKYLI